MSAKWGSPVEVERRNRIKLSIAAYAYEFEDDVIMSDSEFDALALKIQPEMRTKNRRMDKFFRDHFQPHTGMWIHKHPERYKLKSLYTEHYAL